MSKFLRFLGRQRWLRLGLRHRIIRALERKKEFDFVVPFGGFRYSGNSGNYIDWHVYYFGAYEREELWELERITDHKGAVLDVGANTGNHTLTFASSARDVFSFEPYAPVRARLEQVVRSGGAARVTILPYGLGLKDELLTYYAPTNHNFGGGSFVEGFEPTNSPVGALPLRHGDSAIAELGIRSVALVKIDVEGLEQRVLQGLTKTLTTHRPVVFVEFSKSSAATLTDDDYLSLFPPRYLLYSIRGDRRWLTLLNRKGCTFSPLKATTFTHGNVVAIPEERANILDQ